MLDEHELRGKLGSHWSSIFKDWWHNPRANKKNKNNPKFGLGKGEAWYET